MFHISCSVKKLFVLTYTLYFFLPPPVVSVELGSLVSKVPMDSADGGGRGGG